jgi:hypothetical protein
MNKHLGCEDCKQLRDGWYSALSKFSESATRLRDARRNGGNGFELAKCEKDLAWISAANAQTLFDLHRSGRI